MQKVTQLQEREARNGQDIHDLRESNKSIISAMENMNLRLHERVTTCGKEMEESRQKMTTAFNIEHKEIEKELKEVVEKGTATKDDLNKWLNRGIGAWIVASIFILALQSWGAYMFNSSMDQIKEIKSEISIMKIELNKMGVIVNAYQQRYSNNNQQPNQNF